MEQLFSLLVAVIQITLLDITLSGDNVSVIALAIRNLPQKQAKLASLIGVGGAVGLRVIFTCIITLIMAIEWLPIKLVGGIILVKITWDLLNTKEEEENIEVEGNKNLWRAVTSIIIADISMGLDNVLAIAGASHGNTWLIIFGLALSMPIIFFGAKYIAKLMNDHKIIVYIGSALLMYTAFTMITEDRLVSKYITHSLSIAISILFGLTVVAYGMYCIRKENDKDESRVEEILVENKENLAENSGL